LPHRSRVAMPNNSQYPKPEHYAKGLEAAASTVGQQVKFFNASNIRDIDLAFAAVTEWQPDAILVVAQGLFFNRRVQIVTQATFHALPGMYPDSDFVDIGGLMSYGSNPEDEFRLTGVYTGRVLKGEKPATMPVLRASKFEFVINLQTAKTFGIDIPSTLIARADRVIE